MELRKEEIGDYRWWDGEAQLSIIESATEIIGRARVEGWLLVGWLQFPLRKV